MDGIFAGTPPLEALRFLIHEAATVRSGEPKGSNVLTTDDVARAFFEAPATRNICVDIPKENLTEEDRRHDKVGHLQMSLYGTRDASMNWQEEVEKELTKLEFRRGRYNPCLYYHQERGLRTFLHGEDFATVGDRRGAQCFNGVAREQVRDQDPVRRPLRRDITGSRRGWYWCWASPHDSPW